MIGHSDSRTTKAIYGHLFPDSGVKVVAKPGSPERCRLLRS